MTNETKKEVDIADFKSLVESNHKILGLDIGSKRIGVAISTSDMTGALPLRTIKYSNMKGFLKEINEIVKLHEVKALIIGLPLNMDGSEGKSAQSIRDKSRAINLSLNILFFGMRDFQLLQWKNYIQTILKAEKQPIMKKLIV